MASCKECKQVRRDHLEHVAEVLGQSVCIRKGCENPIQHTSGYCNEHQRGWLNQEQHRNFDLTKQVSEVSKRTCTKCNEPRVSTSSYCIEHRREYMKNRYQSLKELQN